MLNWVTRGVFLGYQRNYLELHVDDLFLGDDAWDPATNITNYDPENASRMTPGDVDRASPGAAPGCGWTWSTTAAAARSTSRARRTRSRRSSPPGVHEAFGWINHTYEHPNLDCSTTRTSPAQMTQNQTLGARQRSLPVASRPRP